ncbi:prephenate dehydrogenase [Thermoactinomyces intermedius]|jgi:prephenate dehydrogenase|uniref:Prephenate dehydrogenase n=1 Tax=Thermoactinomyces intermedius TaxID=2024 RepID=A0A8I1AG50_THEIN|nr:prephenate dehydrogenase [Thermoactinomyces intermedius]MBA4548976.1 prephenate dehydrogenase [Thermoactinomyces intermedius]MBA4835548.1 prephenate dehydrogenase [Thermoactinomyces intermedius]MBH8595383.1 prephenate dehydrogenase [Thermoactinomyces intermedius]
MPEKIAILGIGLIGGSLALGLKERTDAVVVGYDRSEKDLRYAMAIGAVDDWTTSLPRAVSDADMIVIALPVGQIKQMIETLAKLPLKPSCIVTDVGSTKSEIMEASRKLKEKGIVFIGGHPMAGSHQSGIQAARSLLFENAYYVLTPDPEASLWEVQKVSQLLYKATRAELVIMDAAHHDRIVGAISHLPHIIAAGLVNVVGNYNEENEWFHRLAAGGFRDLTRIGASHPVMWRDILLSNRKALLKLMDDWIAKMVEVRSAISDGEQEQIEAFFSRSRRLRQQLPDKKRRGILEPRYECHVDVPDQPGVIGKIATLLGNENINISNLEVMENREEIPGVLKIAFKKEKDYLAAISVLRREGLEVFSEDESWEESKV